jgi:mannosyltransferase
VWMTLSLLLALQRGRRYWVVYALVTAVGVYLFVLLLLVSLAHLLTVAVLRRSRRDLVLTTVALACAVALSSPMLVLAARQRYQVGWIRDANLVTLSNVFEYQWFGYSLLAAGAAWLMIACAALVPLLLRRARPRMTAILAVGLPWLVVPTSVLLLTTLVKPLYVARYALVSSPAVALVIAGALTLVRPRVAFAAVTLFALAVAPEYLRQRQVEGNGYDWGAVSSRLSRLLSPTDAVYVHPDLPMTAFRILYPDVVDRYEDPALLGLATADSGLWDRLASPEVAARRAVASQHIALIEDNSDARGATQDLQAFRDSGFVLIRKSGGYSTDIYVLERATPPRDGSGAR